METPDVAGLDGAARPSWLSAQRAAAAVAMETLPFDEAEYARRRTDVRAALRRAEADAVVVFRPSSVEYLCGFHTAETVPQPLLVTESAGTLFVPDFEVGRALAAACPDSIRHFSYAGAHQALASIARAVAREVPEGGRVAVEFGDAAVPPRFVEALRENAVRVVDADYLVERVRLVLSTAEIGYVEAAAVHTQRGVDAAVAAVREPDATDSSVAAAITAALRRQANSASAWHTAVATGARAGIPHAIFNGTPLAPATFIEFAGTQHRYHAPVMRTLCRGRPSPRVAALAELARTAVAAVLDAAKPGVACADVAAQASAALGPLPDDVVFHQLFGYPVGLAHPPHWMDGAPFAITADNPEPLAEGMVFHIPGSFRSFAEAGVGLSHTFVVERTGARVLTHGTAELIEV